MQNTGLASVTGIGELPTSNWPVSYLE